MRPLEQTETISGTIAVVHFLNPDSPWMAGKIKIAKGTVVGFAGAVAANVGDTVELAGKWAMHPKFGKQFEAASGVVQVDESPEALIHLLASNEAFKGIGPARAKKIVEQALMLSRDGEVASALIAYPQEIAERACVDIGIVEEASRIWAARKGHFDALAQLTDHGWTSAQGTKIIKRFGEGAPAIVRANPYALIGKVERFGFRTVDAVALKLGISKTAPMRLMAGVGFCLDRIANNGSTWTTKEGLTAEANQELRPDTLDAEDLIGEAIEDMIATGLIVEGKTPRGTPFLADTQLAQKEAQVFDKLLNGTQSAEGGRPISFAGARAMRAIKTLNEGQALAVHGFASRRTSVLSGGAGVGKTYTMNAICEIAEENGLRVALAAPTGKAARKLEHATQREAKTIHRLLEPMPDMNGGFAFTRGRSNPVEFDLVVIDEVSMVDVKLMHSLLAALPPSCRLLLVGDHNQIPSVGPGAILRDLLASRTRYPAAVNVLTHVVRQAGTLALNTTTILDGVISPESSAVWGVERTEPGHEAGTPGLIAALVESLVTSPTPLEPFGRVLDFAWDIQVLAPMRKGPCGVWALNVELQRLRQRLLGNPPPEHTPEGRSPKPLMGDRVIWTQNDYELGLMNGTQASVIGLPKGGAMRIRTEDGTEVLVPSGKRKHIDVAYAMTIHKSQGSEWPLVVLVASSKHWIMHDRNLLYTGASRASESLAIVGDQIGMRNFAKAQRSESRQTLGAFAAAGWSFEAQGVAS